MKTYKLICEKITCCGECPYMHSPNGTFIRCNHLEGPTDERMENLYVYNEIHDKCPLKDIEVK